MIRSLLPRRGFRLGSALAAALLSYGCVTEQVITVTIGEINVTPGTASLLETQTLQFAAIVQTETGRTLPRATVSWESGDPAIASIDATGMVTALSEGTATLTAEFRGVTGNATVNVIPAPEIQLEVDSAAFAAAVGTTGPTPIVIEIQNGGGSILAGLVTEVIYPSGGPTGWLTAALESPQAPTDLTLTANTASLAVGFYMATVSISSPDDPDSPALLAVTLSVAGVTVTESDGSTSVTEAGSSDSLTVVLQAPPDSNVVIDVTSDDTGEVVATPAALTFTSANWDVPQQVILTGQDELVSDGDQVTPVVLAVDPDLSDLRYDPIPPDSISVTTIDDDVPNLTVTQSGGSTSVGESGSTDDFTVVLDVEPLTSVVLDVTSSDLGEATASPSTLTFTPADWATPQTVTVTGVDDDRIDGAQVTPVVVSVDAPNSDDAFDGLAPDSVQVTTADDDSAGFLVTRVGGAPIDTLVVSEAGSTVDVVVSLTAQPGSNVTVVVTSPDPTEVTVAPASIVFTGSNWNVPIPVTLTGVGDAEIDGNQLTLVAVAIDAPNSDDDFDALPAASLPTRTTDDDIAGFVIAETGGGTSVDESGTTDDFTVVLAAQPQFDVVFDVSSGDTGEATVSVGSLTFTNSNWDTPQSITVTGVDELIDDGDQTTAIAVVVNAAASDDDFDSLPSDSVVVTTVDDDVAGFGITETGGGTLVSETGTTDDFTVVLESEPVSDVVLTLLASRTEEATVSPASLTFTPANWNVPQTVTVTGVNDVDDDGNQFSLIVVAVSGALSDDAYDPLVDQTVQVTTTDDDEPAGFTVTEISGTIVSESGTSDEFTVALDTEPVSDVVLDITSADLGEVIVDQATVTFTSANWNVPQTVAVTGVDDSEIDGPQTTDVTVAVNDAASHDNFDPLPDQLVSVTTTDDDVGDFAVTESSGTTVVSESGTTDVVSVVLASQPASGVVLSAASGDFGEFTVAPATVSFTPSNWDTPQTFTVTGVDDAIIDGAASSVLTIAVVDASSDDNFDPAADQTVTVVTTDDDLPGLSVVESGGSTVVDEAGSTDDFSVVLDSEPTTDVVLTVTSADPSEATVAPLSLTFTNLNWNLPQNVTVSSVDDDLIDGDLVTTISVTVDDAASDDDYDGLFETLSVTTTDDDAPTFTVTESGSTLVSESGTTDAFTVVLGAEPMSAVVLDILTGDPGEVGVTPSSVNFTPANWDTPQTVTVTGIDDALIDGSQVTVVTISVNDDLSDDSFDPIADQIVSVTTTDDDTAGYSVTETGGGTLVTEAGGTDGIEVALTSQPGSNVVLSVSLSDAGEATVGPVSLTFTQANWNVAQIVTVAGVDDDIIDGNQLTTVTFSIVAASSDDDFDGLADQTVIVTTADDDFAGFDISESGGDSQVDESGTTDDLDVVLTAEPVSDVVIDVASGDVAEVTASVASLTFTPANWDTPQTVTVTGVDELIDDGDQVTPVTFAVDAALSDDAFDALADDVRNVTTVDDDTAGVTISETGGGTLVTEGGSTDDFSLVLDTEPVSDVVLNITSGDTGEATVSPATLTFTPTDWFTPQTVTVTGVDDLLDDGSQFTSVGVDVDDPTSDDTYDGVLAQSVTVTTTDDDNPPDMTVTAIGGTTVAEAGTTDDFTVVLDSEPPSPVQIDVTTDMPDEVSVAPTPLIFTPANWDTPQTVTVTGVDDDIIDGPQPSTVTVSIDVANSDPAFGGVADQFVAVTTTDDDVAGFTLSESGGSTLVNEAAGTDQIGVVLDAEPGSNVEVSVISADIGEATVAPAVLIFTPGNWNVEQFVTVTGVDDADIDGAQVTSITFAIIDANSDDDFDALADQVVSVTTTDDDAAGLTVTASGATTEVLESGTADDFTVVLDRGPPTDVVVLVSSGDVGEATVAPISLTFTALNWATPQTVTITGVDDAGADGDQLTTITVSVDDASSHDSYDAVPDETIIVTTIDDDGAGMIVTESGGATLVTEAGSSDIVSVVLTAQPVTSVSIVISSGDTGEAVPSPTTLVFTNGNWDTPQDVAVTGVDDALIDGNQVTTLTIAVDDISSDDTYDPVPDETVTVTTLDDDFAAFLIAESSGGTLVTEGGSTDDFTVVLLSEPTSDVVFDLTSADINEALASPATLTFGPANWDVPQTATVSGVDDQIIDGSQLTDITISVDAASSDDDYDLVADQAVSVTTTDDDASGFSVTESLGATVVTEAGGTDDLSVVLTAQPNSDVVLNVSSANIGEVTASPAALTFTVGTWDTPQTVTVTGVDELIDDGDVSTDVTISVDVAASDDDFDALPDNVTAVTTLDDDVAGFTLVETGGGTLVTEAGSTDQFTIVLNTEPVSDVVLTVVSGDLGEAMASPASVTFTPANWDTPQAATVTGVDDLIDDGSQFTAITVAVNDGASDDAYDGVADGAVTVTTTDDDAPVGFTVTEIGGTTVTEAGSSDDFTVALDSEPASDVVFTITTADASEVVPAPGLLTFTAANWSVPQTVSAVGVDDALLDGPQVTLLTIAVDDAASDDAYDPVPDQTVSVTTTDDDVAGYTVTESGGSTLVNETGTTDDFTVVLDAEPLTNVVFTVTSSDTGESTVAPTPLTFTPATWDTPQSVTVTGVADGLVDGSQSSTITVSVDAGASDDDFDALADFLFTATTTDADAPGIAVAESGGTTSVNESGTTDDFTVVLSSGPTTPVTLNIVSGDTGEATVDLASLTFTPGNWDTPQTVVVTGIDDPANDGDQVTLVTISVDDATSDDTYDPLPDLTVSVTTVDNDAAGITLVESSGSTSVSETGTADDFTLVLDAQPATNVVLTVTSADVGEVTVSPASVTFTNANWDTPQTITVTGIDDALIDGTQITLLTVSVDDLTSDDAYDPLPDLTVSASTTDDDGAGVTVTESGGGSIVSETGTADDFTVVLDAEPTSDVVIDVTSTDPGEVTALPGQLTFTPANWDTPQTVGLTGVDDAVIDGSQLTLVTVAVNDPASDDAFDAVADQSVSVTTTDDDGAGFTVEETGGTTIVSESATTDQFTVVLDAEPMSNVVMNVTSDDSGEATVSSATLTFTTANWATPQAVTVTGVDDSIDDGDQVSTITVSVNDGLSDDDFDPLSDQTVAVTTTDDDAAGFSIVESGGTTVVVETGTTDDFTVVLDTEPVSNVVLTVTSADLGEVTAAPGSLTFTPANWDTPQTVTVTGIDDLLNDGSQVTGVTVAVNDGPSDDAFDPVADQTVSVTTVDNDLAGFTVTQSGGGTVVLESGTTDDFTVVLTAQPGTDVVLTVTSGDPSEVLASPTTLTFTSGNWDTPQTVTVVGVDDDFDDGDRFTLVTVAVDDVNSDDAFDLLADQTVSVTTLDDDGVGFLVTETGGATIVTEAGSADDFTVVLLAEPALDVVLDLSSGDTDEVTINTASLTFTAANWDTPQTVVATGIDELIDDGDVITFITISVNDAASDDDYDPLVDQTLGVTTVDDDDAGFTVTESGGTTVVTEAGSTDVFTVELDTEPVFDVVFSVVSGDVGEATVDQATLTFTSVNWDTPQTVTVTGVDDAVDDGDDVASITISVVDGSSDDAFDPLADQSVSVTVTDDDTAAFTVVESSGSTTVDESGTTDDFTVVLESEPTSNVVMSVVSGDVDEATVSAASLTFTPTTWDTPQSVTVTGADDALVDGSQVTTITVAVVDGSSDDGYDPLADQTVSVTTTDDDAAGFTITESGGTTTVDETGTTDDFTVVLDAEPASDVVLTVSSSDVGEATVAPATLTFTGGNWNTPQIVTVTGVDDAFADGSIVSVVTVAVDDAASDDDFDSLADQTVSVTTSDDDAPGFAVTESGGGTTVSEAGGTDSFDVVLTAQPASDVVFDVSSADVGEVTVSTSSLTFTTANWSTPQTVTVTGVDDIIEDGDVVTLVTVAVNAAASDDGFDPLPAQTVAVTTTDNDVPGFTVTETGGSTSVDEAGSTDLLDVVLTVAPLTDVVLDVSSSDVGEASVSPATLTFTSANWSVTQSITVTGVDDLIVDGPQTSMITVSVNDAASDDAFDPLADQSVSVTTSDDDIPTYTVDESGGSTSVSEAGSTDDFTVVLRRAPLSAVVFDILASDAGEAIASPTTIVFTSGNWNVPQTITVTGVDDALDDGDVISTITVTVDALATEDVWDGMADQTVSITTSDDDMAGFTVTESGGSTDVTEAGTTDGFTVVLDVQPTSNVVLNVSSPDLTEVTVAPSTLTFTAADWNVPQAVTVTGVDDALLDGTTVTAVVVAVNDPASDDMFDPLPDQTVSVSNTSDDVASFTVTEDGTTTVSEAGTTDNFTVVLDAQPASNVVFDVTSSDTGESSVSPGVLTFNAGNWDTPQVVTVTGVDDAFVDGDQPSTVTIAVNTAASDDDFDGMADQTVSVTTIDDDGAGITVAESGGSTVVTEAGGTDDFTVVLTAQPVLDVVVTITSGDTGEATVSAASLTFTTADWDTPQPVTVTGIDDLIDDGSQFTSVTVAIDDAASDDAFDLVADQVVTVTTTDDDLAGFTLAPSGGGTLVTEAGSTDDFTVVLTAEPATDVVITATSGDTDEVAAAPAALTFTNSDWFTPQVVTVTGVDDDFVDGQQFTLVVVSVDDANSDDSFDPLADQQVSVTTTDDDIPGFTFTHVGGATEVSEAGTSDSLLVVLTARPFGSVVFDVVSADVGEVTVTPASLTFTNANWDTPQRIDATGANDFILDGTQTTDITVSINQAGTDAEFDGLAAQTLSASTTDDDVAGFTIVESSGTSLVSETGTMDDFTVVLDAEPTSNVVLDVSSPDIGEVTVSPATLTFTPVTWNVPQTVTLTGQDDPAADGAVVTLVSVTVNAAASDDDFDAVAAQTVSVTTTDDDTPGITVVESGGSSVVNEAGGPDDDFTVMLDAQPVSDVVLTLASANTGEVTVLPATLTFTSANWNTPQPVTVSGVDDEIDDGDQLVDVTIAVDDANSDDAYDPVSDVVISVTNIDDDDAGFAIVESGGSTLVAESGATDDFTVVLESEPTSNVVLDITSGDTGEATVAPAQLTFTPINWETPQSVTVTGVDDGSLVDGDQVIPTAVSVNDAASDDSYDALSDQFVVVTTTDDDPAGYAVSESGGSTTTDEDGGSDQLSIVLTGQPEDDVVFDVTVADATEISADVAQVTFTMANWDTPQIITLTGVDDSPFLDGDQASDVTVSVNAPASYGPFDLLADTTFSATTLDTDVAGFTVTETSVGTTVTEDGTIDSVSVVLTVQPTSDVVFLISSDDLGEATVAPATLTFTMGNWNTVQTVTVTGVDDSPSVDGDQTSTVTVSVDDANSLDAFDGLADQTVSVTTVDTDVPGFSLTQSGGFSSVSESGTMDDMSVVLTSQPASDVVLDIGSGDVGEVTVDSSQVTFTMALWNVPQPLVVTGVSDGALADGDQTTLITVSVNDPLSDDLFDPLGPETASVTTVDTATVGLVVAQSGGITVVSESGTTDDIDITLSAQPLTNVVIDVSAGNPGEATSSPAQLTFTNGNWSVPQTVTVTGVGDSQLVDGDQISTITLAINMAGTDAIFDTVSDNTVSVTTTDQDAATFTLTPSGATNQVTEAGTTDDFTVVLDNEPLSDVVFTVTSADAGEATAAPTPLTFTSANWDTPQPVTVTGVSDASDDGHQSTAITVAIDAGASEDQWDAVPSQNLVFTTIDQDGAGITVVEVGGNTVTDESGTTQNFTVVLDEQPDTDVVITLDNPDTSEILLDAATLTFTTSNWFTSQNVQVTGQDDALADGDTFTTITISVDDANSDDAYDVVSDETVIARNDDDETQQQ